MGMICSGEISDAPLYVLMEQETMNNLNTWGISFYKRFKDDITAFAQSEQAARNFASFLQSKSGPFIIEIEYK